MGPGRKWGRVKVNIAALCPGGELLEGQGRWQPARNQEMTGRIRVPVQPQGRALAPLPKGIQAGLDPAVT